MISWVSGTIGIVAALTIMFLIRRDHLHPRFGLWWIAVAVAFVGFGLYPQAFDHLATRIGIAYGPVLALTLAITVLFIKILVMDIGRTRVEMRVERLVQRVAILESELNQVKGAQLDKSPLRGVGEKSRTGTEDG